MPGECLLKFEVILLKKLSQSLAKDISLVRKILQKSHSLTKFFIRFERRTNVILNSLYVVKYWQTTKLIILKVYQNSFEKTNEDENDKRDREVALSVVTNRQ